MDGPTGSTGPTEEVAGPTGSTGPTEDAPQPAQSLPPTPAPPTPLSLSDILAATELLEQKEAADKATLESIGAMTMDELRSRLIVWGRIGFPNAHTVHSISIAPPATCSDGVSRTLDDYILFCSGKTLSDHIAVLQAKVTSDIQVGFVNFGGSIGIVVTKA